MIIGDLTRADFKRELPKAIADVCEYLNFLGFRRVGTWSSRYHRADLYERYVV